MILISVGLLGDGKGKVWLAYRMDKSVDTVTAQPICVIFLRLGFSFEYLIVLDKLGYIPFGISILNQFEYNLIMLQFRLNLVCRTVKRSIT